MTVDDQMPVIERTPVLGAQSAQAAQYILLPPRGLRGGSLETSELLLAMEGLRGVRNAGVIAGIGIDRDVSVRVIDSVHEDGAKLVELEPESVLALRASQPGIRIVPLVYYQLAAWPEPRPVPSARPASGLSTGIRVRVESTAGQPVADARVVGFTDFKRREGQEAVTDASGEASLPFSRSSVKLERLYVFPRRGVWSRLRRNLVLRAGDAIQLRPLGPADADCLRYFHREAPLETGGGVTVGVLDTGVALDHPDLVVDGGVNSVIGESPADFGDNGMFHGTHVAGIIAGRGTRPAAMRGLAPGVTLRSYRVFGRDTEDGSNYAILKAIDQAVQDGCDLINLSLSGRVPDPATQEAIEDARTKGTVAIVAAGNDGRMSVGYPAAFHFAIAVSAVGRKGKFPSGTSESADVALPFGVDPKNFLAAFSNVGTQIDMADAGVGVISTVPGGYAAMSGTSMACPATTGIAARLLAMAPAVLAMPRDDRRADAIARMLLSSGEELGLGLENEGQGLPNV